MIADRRTPPTPGPEVELRLPRPERRSLAGGPDLVWLRWSGLPATALRLVVPAGADSHGVESAGLASLTGSLLTEGAAGRTSREIADWIDGLGAAVGVSVRYDAAVVKAHSLSEFLPEMLDVLSAVFVRPDFPEHEVERVRAEKLDRLRRLRDDPDEVAADTLAELLYDDRPYGRLPRGRVDTVKALKRADIVAFHASRMVRGAATLICVGDLPDSFPELVADRFTLPGAERRFSRPPEGPRSPATAGTVLIDRPGSRQSVIRIAGIGLARGGADEWAARVMNSVLGGLFNSRLNLNLREDKGWTYGARSVLRLRRGAGPVIMSAAVQTDVTAAAVEEMRREAQRLREEPPVPSEMATAAGALTRSLPLRFETTTHLAEALAEQVVYELPDDYWPDFAASIRAVTGEEVRAAASRYLAPERLVTLVVGDASLVAADLEKLGPVDVREAP